MEENKELELELYAEELPTQINYSAASCCWGSGGCFACASCPGSASTASTGASLCV